MFCFLCFLISKFIQKMLSVVLIGLCVLCMCITEDREGETDAGEEPVEPAKVENVSQCFCFMPEGLQ